jgi:hypothetical protein
MRRSLQAPSLGLMLVTGSIACFAESYDAGALRGMAEQEQDAGRVAGFQVVESYLAVDVTTTPSIDRGTPETEIAFARSWGRTFCDTATNMAAPWQDMVA